MEKEEFNELKKQLGKDLAAEVQSQVDEIRNEVVTKADLETAQEELEKKYGKESEVIKAMQSQMDQIATDVKNAENKFDAKKSNIELTKDALTSEKYKAWKENSNGQPYEFELKTVGDMTRSGNLTGEIPLALQEPGVSKTPDRPTFVQDIIPVAITTSPTIAWIERTAREGGAAATSEGSVYTELDMDYRRYTTTIEKITSYIRISEEMWDDVPFIKGEINSELFGVVDRLMDDDLINGTGSSPEISGIDQYVTTYSKPTGLATTDPTTVDAIRAAQLQVTNAYYYPNYVLMNPTDWTNMTMEKDAQGNPLIPPFLNPSALNIGGMRIATNTNITQGYIYVGDFTKAKIYMRQGILIQMWDQNSSDATYGYKTITAKLRYGLRVSGQDTTAFVKGAIATIVAGL